MIFFFNNNFVIWNKIIEESLSGVSSWAVDENQYFLKCEKTFW